MAINLEDLVEQATGGNASHREIRIVRSALALGCLTAIGAIRDGRSDELIAELIRVKADIKRERHDHRNN